MVATTRPSDEKVLAKQRSQVPGAVSETISDISAKPGAAPTETSTRNRFTAKLEQMQKEDEEREDRKEETPEEEHLFNFTSVKTKLSNKLSVDEPEQAPKRTMPKTQESDDKKFSEEELKVFVEEEELAVAMEVNEYDNKFMPSAIEYDPDSKPPLYQNRRCRLYVTLGACLATLMIAIGIVATIGKSKERPLIVYSTLAPTPAPSPAPTVTKDAAFRAVFAEAVGDRVFEKGTPHYLAADWILWNDNRELDIDDSELLQRFLLAFLWFHSTRNGTTPWRSCNPPQDGETKECTYTDTVFNHEDYTRDEVSIPGQTRWLSETHECDWLGIYCTSELHVVGIDLTYQKLTGTIPTELTKIRYLQLLSFTLNELTGTIPPEISEMKHLIALHLHRNLLTGAIPESFYDGDANALSVVNVGGNLLDGTISTKIGYLSKLLGFHVYENLLTGTVPKEIENLKQLKYCRLYNNTLTGTIPPELFYGDNLVELWAHHNELAGTIPSEVGLATKLIQVRLEYNKLTGTIPEEIYDLTTLQALSLDVNPDLSGTLSTRIGQLTRLTDLRVSENKIGGTIPTQVAQLSNLVLFFLHLNEFEGSVPLEVCGLDHLRILQADCNPVDNPPVPCRCCGACCDRATGICLLT